MIILNPLPEPKITLRRTLAQNCGLGPQRSFTLANLTYQFVFYEYSPSDMVLELMARRFQVYYQEVPTYLEDRSQCYHHSGSACRSRHLNTTCDRYRFNALTNNQLMGKVAKRQMVQALYGR